MSFTFTQPQKDLLIGVLLAEAIQSNRKSILVVGNSDDQFLMPALTKMVTDGYLVVKGNSYQFTDAGTQLVEKFSKRYEDMSNLYRVFSWVDMDTAEFAMAKFFDMDENAWNVYTNDERWQDLRVAVMDFKKLDPLELIFLSFIEEGRIDMEKSGWQFDLALGGVWTEIENICNSLLTIDQVGGPDIVAEIIKQGTAVMVDVLNRKAELEKEQVAQNGTEEVVEETVVEEVVYDPYIIEPVYLVDPFYVPWYWYW